MKVSPWPYVALAPYRYFSSRLKQESIFTLTAECLAIFLHLYMPRRDKILKRSEAEFWGFALKGRLNIRRNEIFSG